MVQAGNRCGGGVRLTARCVGFVRRGVDVRSIQLLESERIGRPVRDKEFTSVKLRGL